MAPSRATSTGPPKASLGLLARPVVAELVGDVGDDDPLGAGALGVLAGLRGGQVPADAGALGPRQRRLDDQQVGVAGDLDHLLAGAGVGAVGELAAALARDVDREGVDEVRHRVEAGS